MLVGWFQAGFWASCGNIYEVVCESIEFQLFWGFYSTQHNAFCISNKIS
jgi:hypothetical protein